MTKLEPNGRKRKKHSIVFIRPSPFFFFLLSTVLCRLISAYTLLFFGLIDSVQSHKTENFFIPPRIHAIFKYIQITRKFLHPSHPTRMYPNVFHLYTIFKDRKREKQKDFSKKTILFI